MVSKKTMKQGITIVGGRPMHRAVDAAQLPKGVEQVLALSALDYSFRKKVQKDPVAAATEKGIVLDEVEIALLRSTKPEDLTQMAELLVIPKKANRRDFVKAVSASIVAMVTGRAIMLCAGCTGADTWCETSSDNPEQKWMTLNGHTCYVYLPSSVVCRPRDGAPVLVALSDAGETCLSNIQRWSAASDSYGFSIISVNWTEEATTPEAQAQLVSDLPGIISQFNENYKTTDNFLSSRGVATDMAWQVIKLSLASGPWWSGMIFLGGAPQGDWINNAQALLAGITELPEILHVIGKQDPEYPQAEAFWTAVVVNSLRPINTEILEGTTATAVLDFSSLWERILW